MVNNSTDINKINKDIAPQIIKDKESTTYDSEIQVLAWDRRTQCDGVKLGNDKQ